MIVRQLLEFAPTAQVVMLSILVLLVTTSGMGVAYVKYESRRLFTEKERLRTHRDEMVVEWGRLQIELATWSGHGRVTELASEKLKMRMPGIADIVIIEADEK